MSRQRTTLVLFGASVFAVLNAAAVSAQTLSSETRLLTPADVELFRMNLEAIIEIKKIENEFRPTFNELELEKIRQEMLFEYEKEEQRKQFEYEKRQHQARDTGERNSPKLRIHHGNWIEDSLSAR